MPAPGLPLAISRGYRSLPLAQVTITSLFHFQFGHNRIQFTDCLYLNSQPSYPEHFAMWSAAGKNKCNLHTDIIIAISPMLISGKRFEQSHPKQPQKCWIFWRSHTTLSTVCSIPNQTLEVCICFSMSYTPISPPAEVVVIQECTIQKWHSYCASLWFATCHQPWSPLASTTSPSLFAIVFRNTRAFTVVIPRAFCNVLQYVQPLWGW